MKKTKKQKRLEVLKDALKQLNAKKIEACVGEVFIPINDELNYDHYYDNEIRGKEQVQPILKKLLSDKTINHPVCEVCARGALLISTVHKFNAFNLKQLNESDQSFNPDRDENKKLLTLFSGTQLAMMECAFETDSWTDKGDKDDEILPFCLNYPEYLSKKQAISSYKFGLKYDNPNDRLKAIFKNAIKNEGLFKP